MKNILVLATVLISTAGTANAFNGTMVANCQSASGKMKVYTATSITTKAGKTYFQVYSPATNSYVTTASTTATCTIMVGGFLSPQ